MFPRVWMPPDWNVFKAIWKPGCGRLSSRLETPCATPSNKSPRGSRGPEAGVRGIPSPFINLDERGRDTPHPSLLPLLLPRKDLFAGLPRWIAGRSGSVAAAHHQAQHVPEHQRDRGEQLHRGRHVAILGIIVNDVGGVIEHRHAGEPDHGHREPGAELEAE